MGLPSTYDATSWADLYSQIVGAATAAQGTDPASGLPIVTNGQALALLHTLRDVARAQRITVPLWPELWYGLLGHVRVNDRFLMTAVHAAKIATPDLLEATWKALERMCSDFDKLLGAAPIVVKVDQSWGGYKRAANDAWVQMQKDRLLVKPPPPKLPPVPRLNPIPKGTGMLLALIAIALLMRKR